MYHRLHVQIIIFVPENSLHYNKFSSNSTLNIGENESYHKRYHHNIFIFTLIIISLQILGIYVVHSLI